MNRKYDVQFVTGNKVSWWRSTVIFSWFLFPFWPLMTANIPFQISANYEGETQSSPFNSNSAQSEVGRLVVSFSLFSIEGERRENFNSFPWNSHSLQHSIKLEVHG
jgi:hypothetical protein